MGKKKNNGQNQPLSAKKSHKKSAAYLQGSGGGSYAMKQRKRQLAEDEAAADIRKGRPVRHSAVFATATAVYEDNTFEQEPARPARHPRYERDYTKPATLLITDSYNGGANKVTNLLHGEISFPALTDPNRRNKPCFLLARLEDDQSWTVFRYTGYGNEDGTFAGVIDEAKVSYLHLESDMVRALAEWDKNQEYQNRSSIQNELFVDAQRVSRDSVERPAPRRSSRRYDNERSNYASDSLFGSDWYPFRW